MNTNNRSRWQLAQDYEINWWKGYTRDIKWYRDFSKEVEDVVGPYINITGETKILEIGSGPAGALTFLKSDNKYAIDPLEDFFSSDEEWVSFRDPKVKYLKGKGEKLHFDNDYFDLIIIDNVLDHCENPVKVLDEMNRTLKKNGVIFFRQNVYNRWGAFMRKLMELKKIDRGHPFTFGKNQLVNLFKMRSWEIKLYRDSGYVQSWIKNVHDLSLKGIVKTFLFITRNRTLFVLQKI
ncbi:MAG: class I SAM-dependent methyltransferase [Candidatus Latescibacteria bacterium]|nr:class I SAM-dependent methyltransferase [Candidatus Latescibacterota bacterium]